MCLESDLAGAERANRRALELDPEYAEALVWLGVVQSCQGLVGEAVETAKRAVAMDPHAPYVSEVRILVELMAGRYDQVLAARDAVFELEPRSVIAIYMGAMALTMLGRHRESLDDWARVLELPNGQPTFRAWRTYSLMQASEEARALEELDALREMRDQEGLPAGILVLACSAIGQADEAFHWLDVADREEGGVSLLLFCGVPPSIPSGETRASGIA